MYLVMKVNGRRRNQSPVAASLTWQMQNMYVVCDRKFSFEKLQNNMYSITGIIRMIKLRGLKG
jgi:hypothetical protein